jgi:TolA-binding protein
LPDAAQQPIDVDLQTLEQTLQQMQSRYDKIMQVEDLRLKINVNKARKHASQQLGTAESADKAAKLMMIELKRVRVDLISKGTV